MSVQGAQSGTGNQSVANQEFLNTLTPEEKQQLVKIANTITYEYDASGQTQFGGKSADGNLPLDRPEMSPTEALALLQTFMAKINSANMDGAQEGIEATADEQKRVREERMEAMQKVAEMVKKAQKKGLLGKILGWCGVAVAVIAAIAVSVGTFGAGAPASGLAVAACIACVAGATLGTTTQIVTSIPGAMEGMGKDGAKAFMYTMLALQILCAITSLGAGLAGSAGSTTAAGANVADDAVGVADDIAMAAGGAADDAAGLADDVAATSQAASRMEKVATGVEQGAKVTEAGTEIASAANDMEIAELEKKRENSEADALEFAKLLKMLAANEEKEIEFIKVILELESKGQQALGQCFSRQHEADKAVSEYRIEG